MAEGKGRFLPSKAAAIEEVRRLQARGIRNIDVGCLQVNLHYHPDAFASLETAFDPEANAAYAAALLVRLREEARSSTRAIGQYPSRQAIRGHGGLEERRVGKEGVSARRPRRARYSKKTNLTDNSHRQCRNAKQQ